MQQVYENPEASGSGPTLDLAVADAIDRFEMEAGAATNWEHDLHISMGMMKVYVTHASYRHSYSKSAPSVEVTFRAIASIK